jgi:hypothetical protein
MTSLRSSQLANVAVEGGTAHLDASQMAAVSVLSNPAAAGLRASQLFVVSVIANGKNILPLGPVLRLPCWQPCTAYGTRSIVIRFN